MIRLLSILLISIVLAFRPLIPVLDYVINYDYIVSELCENRYEPEILCNGKCYLAKEISKTSESDDSRKADTKMFSMKVIDNFTCSEVSEILAFNFHLNKLKEVIPYQNYYKFIFHDKQLKPPIV